MPLLEAILPASMMHTRRENEASREWFGGVRRRCIGPRRPWPRRGKAKAATVILTLDHRRRQHICLVGASVCGGTALRAAEILGVQHVLGIEIEK
jgi:hypothetical protein